MTSDGSTSQKQTVVGRYQSTDRSQSQLTETLSTLSKRPESLCQVLEALPKAQKPSAEGVALLSEVLSFLHRCDSGFKKKD